jgi:hypothetical protein
MWKEADTAISRHSRGRAEKNQEIRDKDNLCPGRDSNEAPVKYKSEHSRLSQLAQ